MNTLIEEVQKHVEMQLKSELDSCIVYHNLTHTKEVVEQARELAEAHSLDDRAAELLLIAAWFHDFGFVSSCAEHEKLGARLAESFLQERGLSEEEISAVRNMILSTAMGVKPQTLSEQILNDADLSHLASPHAFEKSIQLRREWEKTLGKVYTDVEWYAMNCEFFDNHEYYTEIAKKRFEEGKARNRAILAELSSIAERSREQEVKKKKKKNGSKKKQKNASSILDDSDYPTAKLDRGIESMFRITLRNHIDLSAIADNKANIMLSVNAVIVSIILSVLVRKLDEYPHLMVPTLLLLGVCVTTIIFATLATRPNITSGHVSEEEIAQKKTNLLFFGNFTRVSFDTYLDNMKTLIADKQYLYDSMIRDLYYLGQAVNRKYKFLRLCYNVFMFGLILSVLSFGIAEMFAPDATNVVIQEIIQE